MKPMTVLMPVYNGGPFLAGAISSVLSQTFKDFELLIVDDGSVDDSREIIRSFRDLRIRTAQNGRNLGIVETLNRGLAEAVTPWIARCDADDLCHPQRLEKQMARAHAAHGIGFVGCDSRILNERGKWQGFGRTASSHESICWDLCFRNPFAHSSAVFLREGAEYRPVPAAEDYDLWSRIARFNTMASVPLPLVDYRQHSESIMAKHSASAQTSKNEGILKIKKANLRELGGLPDGHPDLKRLAEGGMDPPKDRGEIRAYWNAYRRLLARVPRRPDTGLIVSEHLFTQFCQYRSRNLAGLFLSSLPATFLAKLPLFRTLFSLAIRNPCRPYCQRETD